MAGRDQHYVPKTYLRAWENEVSSKKEPDKKFKGVYHYYKNDLTTGDGRNVESILSRYHTYTIDFDHSFVFNEMPEVARDYGKKIQGIINQREVMAYYQGRKLDTIESLISDEAFQHLEEWVFYKKDNPKRLAKKKAILNNIREVHSYEIEKKLDDFLEKEWQKTRDSFIDKVTEGAKCGSVQDVRVNHTLATKLIYNVLIMMCRNPEFNCMGIFPAIGTTFMNIFSANETDNENMEKAEKLVKLLLHGAWLAEIYKGLFDTKKGFCEVFSKGIQKNCKMTLLYCSESSGSFITSDNPAFMFLSNVTKNNRNGLYLPLTPHHLLLIGKGIDDIENVDM